MMRIIVLTGVITMQINWYWLIVGLVPYTIKQQKATNDQDLTVKALFWQLTIRWGNGRRSWNLSIPFIEHLRQ
jgi:hypothetical protein